MVHGAPSYQLKSELMELNITKTGGQIAPVKFKIGNRWVSPYSLPPWKPANQPKGTWPILRVLRGDFFCLPFGVSKGVPEVHGDTANREWDLIKKEKNSIVMELAMKAVKGKIRKTIHTAGRVIYQEHIVSGVHGKYNFGHHAIIQFPDKGGPFKVNTAPFKYGSVKPEAFSLAENLEYGALKTGARFSSLAKVALATGGTTSLHDYPARTGYEDLVMVATRDNKFAWTAATLDGYIWIQLKNPRQFPCTIFWISNGGRHGAPWNSKHNNRLGLEEVCSHFSDGLEESRKDRLNKFKVPTTADFSKTRPTILRLIQLVHPVPADFGMVSNIKKELDAIVVTGAKGKKVRIPVETEFLG
jgi:hypothetical protein